MKVEDSAAKIVIDWFSRVSAAFVGALLALVLFVIVAKFYVVYKIDEFTKIWAEFLQGFYWLSRAKWLDRYTEAVPKGPTAEWVSKAPPGLAAHRSSAARLQTATARAIAPGESACCPQAG